MVRILVQNGFEGKKNYIEAAKGKTDRLHTDNHQ
jgi:hypothetical protein